MATNVTFNGTTYSIPAEGDSGWGTVLSNYFIAIAAGALQKSGGSFTLTAEVDFGATYGLKSAYLKSRATNPSGTGIVRLGNTEAVSWRNAANNADLGLAVNASNALQFNGANLLAAGAAAIVNADIAAGAAIDLSKLAALTASRALVSDGSGVISPATTTATEIGYLNGVTSAIQTQIDGKEPSFTTLPVSKGGTNSGAALNNNRVMQSSGGAIVEASAITASRALVSDTNGIPTHSTVTTTEIQRLSGVGSTVSGNSDSATLSNKTFSDAVTLAEIATPSTPASGFGKVYFKSDGKLYQLNDDGTESAVGSGSGGGTNYISGNPDAESSTTGWATYSGGTTTPTSGTGGSPASTFTRSTSSPLAGTASFLWTKSGTTSRQGEGFSYAFTIDATNQGKPLQIDFDWALVSGTWAGSVTPGTNSDMVVYIYDVTNSQLIEPTGKLLDPAVTGQFYRYRGTFQTAINSTSYRLIVHTATTSASDYTLKFDNFKVGPQVISNGVPASDAASFTPTGSWSTNTTYTGKTWRVADRAYFEVKVSLSGAPTAANLTINLPSGMAIDTAKLSGGTSLDTPLGGKVTILDGGTAYFGGQVFYSSTTAVGVQYLLNPSATFVHYGPVSSTAPITFGNTDTITVQFDVPIVGWSSNVQMSNDTDTRVISARISKNGTQAFSSETKLTSWTIQSDRSGMWDGTNNRFNIAVPGDYQISVQVNAIPGTTATQIPAYRVNGGGSYYLGGTQQASAGDRMGGTTLIPGLKAGDYVEIYHYTSASTTVQAGDSSTYVSLHRLSGPAQIAASESVSVIARNVSGTSLTTATETDVVYATGVADSHSAYNTSTGVFTAPSAGRYLFSASATVVPIASFNGSTETLQIYLANSANTVYSGSVVSLMPPNTGGSGLLTVQLSQQLRLAAGDTVKVRMYQDSGGTQTLSTTANHANSLSITRVGNY